MTDSDAPRPLIPPHIAWPLFVVLLLAMSVAAAITTAVLSQSDGGAQVVDGYQAP